MSSVQPEDTLGNPKITKSFSFSANIRFFFPAKLNFWPNKVHFRPISGARQPQTHTQKPLSRPQPPTRKKARNRISADRGDRLGQDKIIYKFPGRKPAGRPAAHSSRLRRRRPHEATRKNLGEKKNFCREKKNFRRGSFYFRREKRTPGRHPPFRHENRTHGETVYKFFVPLQPLHPPTLQTILQA